MFVKFGKLVGLAAVLAVCVLASCARGMDGGAGKNEPGDAAVSMEQLYAEQGQPVSVRQLEAEDFSVYLKYPTVIYASSESTAYSIISDVVRSISKKVGDTVAKDEVIVSFSTENQQLQQALLSHENALAAFNRSSALFKNNDISRQEYETAKLRYEAARATLRAANDMIYIKAPIAGTITQINVHPTENIRSGAPLFTVSGQSGVEARFYVGGDEIDRIRTGARVFIDSVTAAPKTEGRVTQVSLIMDSQKQAFPVTAFFDVKDDRRLISGMGLDIAVETYRNEKAIVLSRNEVVSTENGYMAFISEENTAYPVAIEVGQEKGFTLEVTGGLREGDLLICDGLQRLSAGTNLKTLLAARDPALIASAGNFAGSTAQGR
ncbi:hypothetical protein FACS1894109_09660 [Spirochaetia bacterium]|nr:hypothetical protein FACS1894109_09660 [Spirochaetia bacterium]